MVRPYWQHFQTKTWLPNCRSARVWNPDIERERHDYYSSKYFNLYQCCHAPQMSVSVCTFVLVCKSGAHEWNADCKYAVNGLHVGDTDQKQIQCLYLHFRTSEASKVSTYCSKWNRLSLSLIAVNGITLMTRPYWQHNQTTMFESLESRHWERASWYWSWLL